MTYKFSKDHAMNDQNASATQVQHGMPHVAARNSRLSRITRGLLAGLGAAVLLVATPALAAVAPDLGSTDTFGIVSETWSESDTPTSTTITGDVCYTTAPAALGSITISGLVETPCNPAKGTDQGNALAELNAESCTSLGAGPIELNATSIGGGSPGVFPPGCYSSDGAMNITTGTTVTLSGAGVYIFRPGGAFNQAADSHVVMAGGVCENDVFWTPIGATTIGANANIVGNIFRGTADGLSITFGNSSSLVGRALAFGSTVTTANTSISVPTCAAFVPPVTLPGEVELGKVFSLASISAGGVSRLTITLSNNNPGVATLTAPLIDTLPANVVIAPTPNAITTCGGAGALVAVAGGTTVTLPAGRTIPGGAPGTCTVAVNVTSSVVGGHTNTLPIGALATDLASNTVAASADLTVAGAAVATTLSTVASPGVTLGGAIYDTATLSGGNAPTGTITFNLYAPSDSACAGAPVFTSLVPVNGNGSYTSASFTSAAIGTYRWIANYSGDADNAATANTCNAANESVDVTAAPPPASIPTLSEWAMIMLVALLAMTGFVAMRRQV